MQYLPIQSHSSIQTYYQNASLANLYANTSLILLITGLLLTLKIVMKKEQGTDKLQQQIKKLERIYLLECEDNNIR